MGLKFCKDRCHATIFRLLITSLYELSEMGLINFKICVYDFKDTAQTSFHTETLCLQITENFKKC